MKEVTREQMVRAFYRPTRKEIGRKTPTAEEMADLLSVIPRSSACAIAAELGARTGMRLSEVLGIRAGELSDTGTMWVGTGTARRRLALDGLLWDFLGHAAREKDGTARLIPVTRQAVTGLLKRYSQWSYNDLRAGFAAEYLILGGDILALSLIMGMKPASVCKLLQLRAPRVDVVEVVSPL